jgi:disulfide bond formation protein DsbB
MASLDRLIPLAILAASLGALGTAYTAEYAFGLEPCRLCLYQRLPYAVTAILALLMFGLPRRYMTAAVVLTAVVFLAGAGLAFHHVGVEQDWWASAASCGATTELPATTEELLASLTPEPPCDTPAWTLFGVSMAGYNLAASYVLAFACLAGAVKLRRAA